MALELVDPPDLDDYQAGEPDLMLAAAEATVRSYCGWHIAPEHTGDTTTFGYPFSSVLFLPTLYLTEVTTVTEDGTVLDVDEFTVNRAGWLGRVSPCTVAWDQAVETVVEFTHGYATVPADVRQVVLALANRSVTSPGNLSRVGQVQYVSGSDAFTDAEKAILRHYRIPASL